MKKYSEFISEAPTEAQAAKMAPGMSPEKRRAALERNARNQARRDTPMTPKKRPALPLGQRGGDMEKRTGSAMVQNKPGAIMKPGSTNNNARPGEKPKIGFYTKPDGPETSTSVSRRAAREKSRNKKLENIKRERGQKLKQGFKDVKTVSDFVRDRIVGKGSGTIGTAGGGDTSDRSVRYH